MKFEHNRTPLLISCLTISLALHAGVFYYFYRCPPSLASPEATNWTKVKAFPEAFPLIQDELLTTRIEQALEESLNHISKGAFLPEKREGDVAIESIAGPSTLEEPVLETQTDLQASLLYHDELALLSLLEEKLFLPPLLDLQADDFLLDFVFEEEGGKEKASFEYHSEKYASLDLIESLLPSGLPPTITASTPIEVEKEQLEPKAHPTTVDAQLTLTYFPEVSLEKLDLSVDISNKSQLLPSFQLNEGTIPRLILPSAVDYLREEWLKRTLADRTLPDIEYYGIGELVSPIEWEEDLATDVSYIPDPDSSRYIFSITLHPEADLIVEKLPQHFYFCIDRSQSKEKQRFSRCKRAVQRALAALNEEDTFNIVLFDKQVVRLSDKNLTANAKSIQKAHEFLENHQSRPLYTKEAYISIDKLLPEKLNPEEMHSLILISDGNLLMNDIQQKRAFAEWIKTNQKWVNIYAATSGSGNNLPLLDLLSYATAGKFLHSDTHSGFPRKLVKLIKDLHDPLIKSVTADIIAKDSGARIELVGGRNALPPMFANRPYTLIGTIDELCDFTLLIQGKSGERYLNIKKNISLKEATQGGRQLNKLWVNSQVSHCYERFLESGKKIHLREAKELIAPFEKGVALE